MISKYMEEKLKEAGIPVTMTRVDENNSLYFHH